jgi:hypothetical protein
MSSIDRRIPLRSARTWEVNLIEIKLSFNTLQLYPRQSREEHVQAACSEVVDHVGEILRAAVDKVRAVLVRLPSSGTQHGKEEGTFEFQKRLF